MLFAIFKKDFYKDNTIQPRLLRLGALSGIFIYGIFGIVDVYMLPETYKTAWFIRFGLVSPVLVIVYILTYNKKFSQLARFWLAGLMVMGQIGIVYMIMAAKPGEEAYWGYYAGLILVMLWSEFIFRLSMGMIIFMSVSTIILYNLVAIGAQGLLSESAGDKEFAWFLGNNFFLFFACVLSVFGAYQLNQYEKKIIENYKLLEDESKKLKNALARAEESDKLKSAFLHNLSHEIRTPLNSIMGFSDIIQNTESDIEHIKQYSNLIYLSSERLLNIVNDVVNLSLLDSGQEKVNYQQFDLTLLLDKLNKRYKDIAESKNLQFELIKNECVTTYDVVTDLNKLEIIISKFLDNAFKFTTEGSITLECTKKNQEFIFCVSDTGIGIEKEMQEHIFKHFRQVEIGNMRNYEGAGIGLTLAKGYTKLLKGKLWLDSEYGKGSAFYVSFEFRYSVKQAETTSNNKLLDTKKEQPKIIIAEDEESNYYYLEALFKNMKYQIKWVKNGKDLIHELAGNNYDLILLDIKMPVMDGYEVLKHLKSQNVKTPVIAQTAYYSVEDEVILKEMGASDYISKPIRKNDLLKLIEKHI